MCICEHQLRVGEIWGQTILDDANVSFRNVLQILNTIDPESPLFKSQLRKAIKELENGARRLSEYYENVRTLDQYVWGVKAEELQRIAEKKYGRRLTQEELELAACILKNTLIEQGLKEDLYHIVASVVETRLMKEGV